MKFCLNILDRNIALDAIEPLSCVIKIDIYKSARRQWSF